MKHKKTSSKLSKTLRKTFNQKTQTLVPKIECSFGTMHASKDDIKDIFDEMTRSNIDNRINRMSDY